MRISNTSERLKAIMKERNIAQVDILQAAKPFCIQYGVKLGKSDLSQYVNGKVEPKQEKLTILGLALGVNEAWLMGYDVPESREDTSAPRSAVVHISHHELTPEESDLLHKYRALDELGRGRVRNVLDYEYNSIPGSKADIAPKEA